MGNGWHNCDAKTHGDSPAVDWGTRSLIPAASELKLVERNLAPDRADERLKLGFVVRDGSHQAPNGPRPGAVTLPTRDHMHMQLRYYIAKRGDVELVAAGNLLQRARNPRDL